jgi:hypothetical protein
VWVAHLDRYLNRSEWLAYSFNNDWEEARNRFAKLLYLATRLKLSEDNTGTAFTSASTALFAQPLVSPVVSGSEPAAGDLLELATVTGLNAAVTALLSKVEVKVVVQANSALGNATVQLANLAGLTTNEAKVTELLNNVIVVRNDLTMEDISKPVAELTTGNVNSVLATMAAVSVVNYHNYGNFLDGSDNPVYNAKLQLNGHDRFQARDGNYFNYVQPFQHFSNTPSDGVNVYSFALKAEDHQPTGTCNFSRIDNATLQVDVGLYNAAAPDNSYATNFVGNGSGSLLNIYTMNYNVLRVMSGMAGTAYSN